MLKYLFFITVGSLIITMYAIALGANTDNTDTDCKHKDDCKCDENCKCKRK